MATFIRRRHDPHYVSIVIRPASRTRGALSITVHQDKDAAGNWLIPTITFSEAIPQTTEDVIFMQTIAAGLMIACLEFLDMMEFIE